MVTESCIGEQSSNLCGGNEPLWLKYWASEQWEATHSHRVVLTGFTAEVRQVLETAKETDITRPRSIPKKRQPAVVV